MFAGYILIKLQNGDQIAYANKYLVAKSGDDGEGNTKLAGEPGYCYYWTGRGDDKLANQTGPGKIIGDYDKIIGQWHLEQDDFLFFPEADASHGDIIDLIRHNNDFWLTNTDAQVQTRVKVGQISSIELITRWVYAPLEGREGSYVLPTDNPYFRGTNEYMEHKIEHRSDLINMSTDQTSSVEFPYPKQLLPTTLNPKSEKGPTPTTVRPVTDPKYPGFTAKS